MGLHTKPNCGKLPIGAGPNACRIKKGSRASCLNGARQSFTRSFPVPNGSVSGGLCRSSARTGAPASAAITPPHPAAEAARSGDSCSSSAAAASGSAARDREGLAAALLWPHISVNRLHTVLRIYIQYCRFLDQVQKFTDSCNARHIPYCVFSQESKCQTGGQTGV